MRIRSFNSEFSPEIALILSCSRVELTDRDATQIRFLMKQELDWEFIRFAATRNRVIPLMYHHLQRLCPELIPDDLEEAWGRLVRVTGLRNLIYTDALIAVLNLLRRQEIDAIPYKGPVLAQTVYGDLSLRQFGDIDVVVPEVEAIRARDYLCANGFRMVWPEISLTAGQERQHVKNKYNFTLVQEEDGIELELHWAVANRYLDFPPEPALLWQNLETVTLAGRTLPAFRPEVQLLVLCVHGSNHCWNRLSWVCDIAEVCNRCEIDFFLLLQLAREWQARRMLAIGLQLASSLLNLKLPPRVQQAVLADQTAVFLAQQSRKWLFSPRFLPFAPLEEPAYQLRMLDRWQNRLQYGLEMLKPSARDWAFVTLPPFAAGLYYLIRPIRLLVEHGITLRSPD